MKPSPADTTIRLIATDKDEPIAIELFGLRPKKLKKGEPEAKYSVKTNKSDQMALVEDGIVICHLTAMDEIDAAFIQMVNGNVKLVARKGDAGVYPVFVVDSPVPGKQAILIEAVGQKSEPVVKNEFALGASAKSDNASEQLA